MTTRHRSAAHLSSLREDLLDALCDDPGPASVAPVEQPTLVPTREPARPIAADAPPRPRAHLEVTPWSWSSAGWTHRPEGDGLTISLGPVRLSLRDLRP